MYRFRITSTVKNELKRLDELQEQLDRRGPLPRVWLGWTRRDLEAEAIAASTSMEGVTVTVEEVRRILAGEHPHEVSPEDQALVLGYREAMEYVLRRADDPTFAWHTELVLGLHDRAMARSYAHGAGRFRETQNWLTRASDGAQVYLPPPSQDVPGLVEEMCAWAQKNAGLAPPVLAAGLHVRLAGVHPFRDGNGRTARILSSLAMYRGGFRLPEFTSLEEWWGRHLADYYAAFACLGDQWNPGTDVTPFIEAHLAAQVAQVEALSLRQDTERALWTVLEDIATVDLEMDRRAASALYDAFFARAVTNGYYRRATDVSVATATKDLARLAASGLLQSVGKRRGRAYYSGIKLYEAVVSGAGLSGQVQIDPAMPRQMLRDLLVAALAARVKVGKSPS